MVYFRCVYFINIDEQTSKWKFAQSTCLQLHVSHPLCHEFTAEFVISNREWKIIVLHEQLEI